LEQWKKEQGDSMATDAPLALRPGQDLVHRNETFKILSVLGYGSQGRVYLVEGRLGRFVLKEFKPHARHRIEAHNNELQKQAVRELEEAPENPLYSPVIHSVDDGNGTVLMEYIEGVPLDILVEHPKIYGSYGLTIPESVEIRAHASRFLESQPYNIILEISTGRFYRVDPF
jgi:serine/threonine protein kinase